MAKLTKGYPFAFQLLGYFAWKYDAFDEQAFTDFKLYLDEYVYEKIWSELSAKDRSVAWAIAKTPGGRIREIRQLLGMDTNQFNPYRKRLIRKGIVNGETYGIMEFTLPLFDMFVLENYTDLSEQTENYFENFTD